MPAGIPGGGGGAENVANNTVYSLYADPAYPQLAYILGVSINLLQGPAHDMYVHILEFASTTVKDSVLEMTVPPSNVVPLVHDVMC